MHWFAFAGGWAFAALISYIWLFIGSARHDAVFQMRVALLLAVAFCAMSAFCAVQMWRMRKTAVRWRGGTVCWNDDGRELRQELADFEAFRRSWGGSLHIRFKDQTVLKVDPYAQNAPAFLQELAERGGAKFI